MICTFYSFKGGVGRSMALANTAELLFRRGLDVLAIDFDLEAPGLDRFFDIPESATPHAQLLRARGVVDMIASYRSLASLGITDSALDAAAEDGGTESGRSQAPWEPIENFIVPIHAKSPTRRGSLHLMTAGRRDGDEYQRYAEAVAELDVADLYSNWNGQAFFDWLVGELEVFAPAVLIDARTGITEMSGVCSHHLADAVVMLLATNEQNLDGIKSMVRSLEQPELVAKGRNGRPLSLLIAPSRVEQVDGDKLDAFAQRFDEELRPHIDPRVKFQTSAFVDLRIPYVPHYASGESVAVRESPSAKSIDLITAYRRLTTAIVELAATNDPLYLGFHGREETPVVGPVSDFPPAPADFFGRAHALAQVADWLEAGEPQTLLITGAPGSGKSALARRLYELHGREAHAPRRIAFAYHCTGALDEELRFIAGLGRALAVHPRFLQSLIQVATGDTQISLRLRSAIDSSDVAGWNQSSPVDPIESIELGGGDKFATFMNVVARPLHAMADGDDAVQIVVLVDELDAVQPAEDDLPTILSRALRGGMPRNFRMILVSREDSRLGRSLDALSTINLDGDPIGANDISDYAMRRLADVPHIDRVLLAQGIAATSESNFLVARLALDYLQKSSSESMEPWQRLQKVLAGESVTRELSAFFARIVDGLRANEQRWSSRHRPLLGVLAVARGPLELVPLAGILDRPRSEVNDTLRSAASLVRGTYPDGPFVLFHAAFAEYLRGTSELGIDVDCGEHHQRIADYFIEEYREHWNECDDVYPLRHLVLHLIGALEAAQDRRSSRRLTEAIANILFDAEFLQARLVAYGLEGILQEIEYLLEGQRLPDIDGELRGLSTLLQQERVEGSEIETPEAAAAFVSRVLDAAPGLGVGRLVASPKRAVQPNVPRLVPRPDAEVSLLLRTERAAQVEMAMESVPLHQVQFIVSTWRDAHLFGRYWLMLALGLALGSVSLAFASGTLPWSFAYLRPLIVLLLLSALYSMFVLWRRKQNLIEALSTYSARRSLPSKFKDGSCYRIAGSLYVASPFFELATLLIFASLLVCAVVQPNLILHLF